jgi:hypothetical protein
MRSTAAQHCATPPKSPAPEEFTARPRMRFLLSRVANTDARRPRVPDGKSLWHKRSRERLNQDALGMNRWTNCLKSESLPRARLTRSLWKDPPGAVTLFLPLQGPEQSPAPDWACERRDFQKYQSVGFFLITSATRRSLELTRIISPSLTKNTCDRACGTFWVTSGGSG